MCKYKKNISESFYSPHSLIRICLKRPTRLAHGRWLSCYKSTNEWRSSRRDGRGEWMRCREKQNWRQASSDGVTDWADGGMCCFPLGSEGWCAAAWGLCRHSPEPSPTPPHPHSHRPTHCACLGSDRDTKWGMVRFSDWTSSKDQHGPWCHWRPQVMMKPQSQCGHMCLSICLIPWWCPWVFQPWPCWGLWSVLLLLLLEATSGFVICTFSPGTTIHAPTEKGKLLLLCYRWFRCLAKKEGRGKLLSP